jgi:hypothetical protein
MNCVFVVDTINVDTVSVELKNPVLLVIVEIATVDAIIDEPVNVENLSSAKLDTFIFAAIIDDTVNVDVINTVFVVSVENATVDAKIDVPVSVDVVRVELKSPVFAKNVDAVRVELKNPVLLVRVEIATVDAIMDEPVNVENLSSAKLDTLIFAAIIDDTVNVDVINTVFVVSVEPLIVLNRTFCA